MHFEADCFHPASEPRSSQGDEVEPIAIIGLGCRMPGDINGPDELWEFLAARRSAVTAVPDDRWRPFDDGSPQTAQALAAEFGVALPAYDALPGASTASAPAAGAAGAGKAGKAAPGAASMAGPVGLA